MKSDTILAGLGGKTDQATGGLVPPLHMGVTHMLSADGPSVGYVRGGVPGGSDVEHLMSRIEGGAAALAFSSGMSAAQAALALLVPGSHLIMEANGYYEFRGIIGRACAARGIDVDLVDLCDRDLVAAAIRPGKTAMIWAELPANPQWQMPDIAALSSLARRANATLLVDATVATPIHCRPLEHGADIVLHSATKYLNGHGDLAAGILVFSNPDHIDIPQCFRTEAGTVLTPFSEWLLLRGLRTLAVRMAHASASALAIARWLSADGHVNIVHYPGLASHPQHDVARRQYQRGFGAMLSFRLVNRADAAKLVRATQIFHAATSLGSTESLIEHRAATEGEGSRCPDDLVRLSIGLEDLGDLLADLQQALSSLR
ncbi:PLP-dependent aspartate aminotransferase family protein [Rhizobium sp. 18055]|uniref:trans-sulfuration enzyme family protein n=1 Tax=Rhizobium sp. 18055 TaxID=2681403 RepID=UPI00135CD8EB|nr:PLP-dependent aspartate aminotransferase family protein [Rhizobium sp. 18055]